MIDWMNHDGVNLPMINDYMRNQFYESIIKHNVQSKKVVDVGFGTGLLSILCLKHGATNVVAYENNAERYQLGLEIIERCGLQDKISLYNEKYTWQTDIDADVIVTETVNGDLWQEGLWNSLPRVNQSLFLPGEYFVELYAKPIPKTFAQSLDANLPPDRCFTPGVDLDSTFVSTVNSYIADWNQQEYIQPDTANVQSGIHYFNNRIEGPWGFIPFMRLVEDKQYLRSTILIDANDTTNLDFDVRYLETTFDLDPDEYSLVVPRCGMKYKEHTLYLDTGHWGPTQDAVIVYGKEQITFRHNLQNGRMQYV